MDPSGELVQLLIKVIRKNNQWIRGLQFPEDFAAFRSAPQNRTLSGSIRLRPNLRITWLIASNSVCYPLRTTCKSFEMIPLLTDPISQPGTVRKVIRIMFSCQRSICFHSSLENWETRISILERMQSYLEHKLCNQVSFPHLTTENTPSSGSTSYFWTPNQGMKSLGLN